MPSSAWPFTFHKGALELWEKEARMLDIEAKPSSNSGARTNNPLNLKHAVSYLRVSTRGQAERGDEHEGFSIPAQREANKNHALSLGAMVIKEFADRGASAKSANRPALQEMLAYIKDPLNQVDYIIVHKIDRLARSREDDVAINRVFKEAGVQLVSTSESVDNTPAGNMLHGILATVAEFYSNNLAKESLKGMTQKVKKGGTVSRAPLGYKNIRYIDNDGREVRTVELDNERADLVRAAFEMYASGEWTVMDLAAELADRGLTTVSTPRIPGKPIDESALNKILINPYYTGLVKFQGIHHPGRHEPLIDKTTFNNVQAVLKSHQQGERTRTHHHFLKSTVYCGTCGSRLMVQIAKARSGTYYLYY
jgi:DNA invertase Pin-like site-specific DNA recombinase